MGDLRHQHVRMVNLRQLAIAATARAALAVGLFALLGCDRIGPQWRGWVYPNGSDLSAHVALGRFDTLDECRRSARTVIANIHLLDEDGEPISSDYECGLRCKADGNLGGLNVCAETSK